MSQKTKVIEKEEVVMKIPFLSIFLITIVSPILSKQNPRTSNPQETFATVAGENIFISFIT